MRLVFWQVNFGPHQIPYIKYTIEDERVDEVILAAPIRFASYRASIGWEEQDITQTSKIKMLKNPSDEVIDEILSTRQEESVHLFSGVRYNTFVERVFKKSTKYNLRRYVITEGPVTYKYNRVNMAPLWIHRIKYYFTEWRYSRYIEGYFAMGENAAHYFRSLNSHWKIFNFGYCTEGRIVEIRQATDTTLNMAFVGYLCKRKGLDMLVNAISGLPEKCKNRLKLSIIGDGPLRGDYEKLVADLNLSDIVSFEGPISNKDIPQTLSEFDVLTLPSRHDGWGAVVNEGLQQGCYIICSNHCGSQDLLRSNRYLGAVFDIKNYKQELQYIISDCIDNAVEIRARKSKVIFWSRKSIGGSAMASYMIDCLCGIKTNVPWSQKL